MYPQTALKTRSGINARLISLSSRNQELEEKLEESERACQRYRIKTNMQNVFISELMDAIHSMSHSSDGSSSATVNTEDTRHLLTKNARRIFELSMELEKMKLQQERVTPAFSANNSSEQTDPSGNGNDRIDDTDLGDNDTIIKSAASPTVYKVVINKLKEENGHLNSKCKALERSMETLKHKQREVEARSMISLKNMRHQLNEMEKERKRRIDMQALAEERASRLKEVFEISRKRGGIVRSRQQLEDQSKAESSSDNKQHDEDEISDYSSSSGSVTSDSSTDSINDETKNKLIAYYLNQCRETVVLRNKMVRSNADLFPPLLVAVSEDSEDDGSDTDSVVRLKHRRGSF
mmetsp:Transcript_23494/g.65215  ORF Transcript_23494/g.65215 Transcript_23494/m.65215 type:complete len:350 (-) Transcript_23494:129-1178(-)